MKTHTSKIVPAALMITGTALAGWGLFAPLAKFPLIGSITYSQPDFGGGNVLAASLICLFGLAAVCLRGEGVIHRLGWILSGMAPGLLIGTLLIRRAWVIDKLQGLADATGQSDAGVDALLSKMETGSGLYTLCLGVLLWAAGLVWRLCSRH